MKLIRKTATALAVLLAATVLPVAPAAAATAERPAPPRSCLVAVDTGEATCYDSRADHTRALNRLRGVRAEMGSLYSDANYQGARLTFHGTLGCYFQYPEFADLSRYGWNDIASSAQATAYCPSMSLYDHTWWAGDSMWFRAMEPWLRGLNDRISSVRLG
ncbi:hypothetical protein ABT354_04730 [Streptomyces sp. NPDC000594]|uniref:hypothetical protein n=1 Tax=Streptomyces sp. NPDC000594 TaxID=3154261 RepID=UPI003332D2E8